MSGGIQVSTPGVDELSARVLLVGSDVKSVAGTVSVMACYDTGDAALSGAIDSFSQFWSAGVNAAHTSVDGTGLSMASAAEQYGVVDSSVMVSPALTEAFIHGTLDGSSGTTDLLIGPMLPSAATAPPTPPLPFPTTGSGSGSTGTSGITGLLEGPLESSGTTPPAPTLPLPFTSSGSSGGH